MVGRLLAVLACAPALWAQSGVTIDTQVVGEARLQVEHQPYAGLVTAILPSTAAVPFPTSTPLAANSGGADASMVLHTMPDYLGRAAVLLEFHCTLQSLGTLGPATGSTQGEFLFTFRSPVPQSGMLWLVFDTRGSQGPTTLGDLFVDVGDDQVLDAAAAGQCSCQQVYEVPFAVDSRGTAVRVLHAGSLWSTQAANAAYHVAMNLSFVPTASAIRPGPPGCAPLRFARWPNGMTTFDFAQPPPVGSCYFLAAGAPAVPGPPLPWLHCGVQCTLDASMLVPGQFALLAPRLLPLGGSAVVQGFVFRLDGVLATDSWTVN